MAFGRMLALLACFALAVVADLPFQDTSNPPAFFPTQVAVQLVDVLDPAPKVQFMSVVPKLEGDCDNVLKLQLRRKNRVSPQFPAPFDGTKTMCICMKSKHQQYEDAPFCEKASRLCVTWDKWYGAKKSDERRIQLDMPESDGFEYIGVEITLKSNKAVASVHDHHKIPFDMLDIETFLPGLAENSEIQIAFVHFIDLTNPLNVNCNGFFMENASCAAVHSEQLYVQAQNQTFRTTTTTTTLAPTTTSEKTTSTVAPPETTTKEEVAGANLGLYIVIGVVVALLLILVILIILRCIQGVWCCGLCCFEIVRKKRRGEDSRDEFKDEVNIKGSGSQDKNAAAAAEQKKAAAENDATATAQKSNDMKVTFQGKDFAQPNQDTETQTQDAKKKPGALVTQEKKKKDEKTSKSSSSSAGGDTKEKETTTADNQTKKRPDVALAPNMLLLATNEDHTQSEAKSKRKNKVDKNYKEVPPTKNDTTIAAAPTKGRKTDAKTGVPKGDTDLNDENGIHVTKGVSATQGEKDTENVETRQTQRGTTVGTTQKGTTQFGTRTTQGGGATTKQTQDATAFATGAAGTRVTGPTQMPTDDTNETQIPTGATRTGATQRPTGATQTGTTQAMTGTTQHGTTMATGRTRGGGTNPTQARTGTRQTGETQNPEETDIDPTQIGQTQGGSRPTAGTQFPTDADADPTQNPTGFTGDAGGGVRTSKTQFPGTGTTQVGTSKTRTRETQKQTNRTKTGM